MTPKDAATVAGCSLRHIHWLIRKKKLRARKIKTTNNQHGYIYWVDPESVQKFAYTQNKRGRPRGGDNAKQYE